MGANNSKGNSYHSSPNEEGKAIQRQNKNTPLGKQKTKLKSYQSSENQDDAEVDIGGKLEKNVLRKNAQVHEVKNSVTCSVTKRLEEENAGASDGTTEIERDGEIEDIISESEVVVSFSSNSAESKNTVDHIDGAVGTVNGSVACDRFSHGSSNIVPAEEKSGGDVNGGIGLVQSDRGGNVCCRLGPADGKKACDRVDHDKGCFGPSDSKMTCDRVDHNHFDIGPTDGKKTCDGVDHDKIDIGPTDGKKTFDRVDQDKNGFGPTDGKKTCDPVDQEKIGLRPTDGRKACDRVNYDKIGFGPAKSIETCNRVDYDKGSTRTANGKSPFDCAFHAIGSVGLADRKVVCAHVGQTNSTIGYADDKDVDDLVGHPSSRHGSCDDSHACDRGGHGSSSVGTPDDKSAFGDCGDASGGIEFVYEDNCDSGGEVSINVRHADGKDLCYRIEDVSNSTTREVGDDAGGACGNTSAGIWYPDNQDAFDGIEAAFYLSDTSFCDADYSEEASDSFVEEFTSGDGVIDSFEERVDVNGGDVYLENYGKVINCWNEEDEEYDEDDVDEEDEEDEEEEYDDDEEELEEEEEEEEGAKEEEEDYYSWVEGYEDENYFDYPEILTHEGNYQGDFKTSKGAFHEDRNRNSRSHPKCQLSRRKTENDHETQLCVKPTLDEHVLVVSGLSETTTKDGLLNFIEVLSGGEVRDITMMKQGNALVTISTQLQGIENMQEKCKKRTLDKSIVTIKTKPAPTSILVSGLSPSASNDLVRLYFESPRSQGGAVEKVHLTRKSGQAVVVFNDSKDMKRVLARQEEHPHVLDGRQLTVSVFHEFLQDLISDPADLPISFPTHDKSERRQVTQQSTQKKVQRQIHLAVDPDIMEFVYESSHLDQLTTLLKDEGGVIDWIPGRRHALIKCPEKPNDDSCQSLCIAIVQSFLDKFVKWDVRIEDDLRNTLQAGSMCAVLSNQGDDPPRVRSITNDSAFYLRIVSLKSKMEFYDKILQEKLVEMHCLERRKSYRVEKITSISEEETTLLRKINFVQTLQDEFKELTVEFDAERREIYLEGPQEELICAKNRYQVQQGKMTEKELHMPKSIMKVLSTVEGLQAIEAEMAANQVDAVFIFEETDEANPHYVAAKVLGISPDHANEASNLISSLTAETIVKIEDRDLRSTTTPEWNQICDEVVQNGKVAIQRDDTGKMWVGGFSKDVISAVKRLNSFLKENASEELIEELPCPSKDARAYLRTCREDDLTTVQTRLEKFDVKILDGEDAKKFVISGHQEGLALARQTLNTLVHGIVTKEMRLKQPGLRTFVSSGKAGDLVKKVEKDQKCVVRVEKIFSKIKQERSTRAAAYAESDSTDSEDDEIVRVEDKSSTPPSTHAASFSVTTQGHTISWKTGNIAQEQVHTVVSSQGACANAVKRSAGPGMLAVAPPAGEIRVSTGFKLPCQHVIHTRCSEWKGGVGEGTLRDIVRKSMCKVDELKGNSIAFPVIGTGNLHFPPNEASRIMLDEVINVCSSNPHFCVKDIRFVVFDQDQSLIAAFQQEMNYLQMNLGGTIPNPSEETWWRKVEVAQGSLTRERADVIVNIIGKDMNLYKAGALSKAVAKDGGEQVIEECRRLGQQPGGSAVMTMGGNLPARHIIHLVPDSSNKQHLQSCLEKCLLLASSSGLRYIAIPAIGTGAYHMTAADSARLTFQALRSVRGSCGSFSQIRIVIYQQDMLGAFTQEHQRVMQFQKPAGETTAPTAKSKSVKNVLGEKKKKKRPSVTSSGSESTVHIFVTGSDELAVSSALDSLKTGFSEACISQVISNECVSRLSDKQVSLLLQNSKTRDVELKLERPKNRIEVRGEAKDVTVMIGEIWRELNERLKRVRAREHAKLLSGHVEWCYVLYGKTRRFSSTRNAKIEEAYSKQCLTVTVDVRGDKFRLDLKNNTGIGSLSGERITISRKVLGPTEGISLPGHWTTMPRQPNGNEVTVHTVRVASHSSEFQRVVQEFKKTAGAVAITKIERIQNPLLYQAYQLRKQKMDRDSGGNNERLLFHGTASRNVKKINSQGFNRNFSGVAHGTALGKGVYFARDASYSMKYTPQGTSGSRYMYLARVLVGRYCHGDPKLVVPPARDPLRPEILFDSVVDDTTNPSIFVAFSDSQCYPEYLIKF